MNAPTSHPDHGPEHGLQDDPADAQTDARQRSSPQTGGVMVAIVNVVVAHWAASGEFTEQTLARCGETVTRFARRLDAQGVTAPAEITLEHCQGFVDATTLKGQAPELTTRHTRRTSLRMLFRTLRELGHPVGDPTLDLHLPVRSVTTARPLTDLEVTLCRASTRLGEAGGVSLQRAVCWALAEATAVTSEITAVRVGDLDNPDQPRWVRLAGTRRHDPRLGELTDWGATIVARQTALLRERRSTPATLLSYRGNGIPGEAVAQASACNAVGAVLSLAGLAEERDVRPASVRNWAGRRLYEAGMPIEHVARRLGARSLDSAAADIALTWRDTT
ncbi:tyrosine-type recombinase/integrase [Nocardioides halotolerans]|uniref:tyrosine-type recombinase/integrase n=1 Tax=Nocardioides halotolerans TaxID=433660 RepID=UPI000406DED5|nr:site-specific integrase [Nocardioides halotolerans]